MKYEVRVRASLEVPIGEVLATFDHEPSDGDLDELMENRNVASVSVDPIGESYIESERPPMRAGGTQQTAVESDRWKDNPSGF